MELTMANAKMETVRNHRSIVVNMPGQPSVDVGLATLTTDIVRQLTLHGLAQKLGDAAARMRNPDTGQPASWAEKHAMVRRVADALIAGDWTLRPEKVAADALTPERVAAVARARDADPARIEAWLTTLTAEHRTKVFAHPSVVVALAAIRADRAAAGSDPDADPFEGLDSPDSPDDNDRAPI
jgi:hypothetical protein